MKGYFPIASYSPEDIAGLKVRKPAFAKDYEKRVSYKEEFIRRMESDTFRAHDGLSPIEIIPRKNLRGHNLCWPGGDDFMGEFALSKAVNKKDKTISIMIHLDRQEKDIIGDILYLLDRIKLAAWFEDFDLSPLKPRWSIYNYYLKVWDLKKEKKSWSEIAKEIFPEVWNPPKQWAQRRVRKHKNSAVGKVRHYYNMAKKMIDEQGGRI